MKLIFQYIWSLHQERPQHSASSVAITMFWKFDLNTTSHVDKLLDKEHVTLQELMDEDDLLQECKAQNRKLLDFLCRQQCMEELVGLITQDPPLDMEEKVRFKFPNTACELLTCDVPQISDRLGEDESLLRLLCNFLDREPPLNPLLASFFSKTIGNLIVRKTEQVIAFLKKKDKFISLVLKHIGTSALMDLLLRLVSCVEPAGLRQEVLNWLNEEKIIQRLVELIHPSQDEDRQSNASQTLCDIIRLGRDQGSQLQEATEPDPLLTALESQDCVEQLLKNMFDGDHTESCLVSGTQVLLTLLETRRAGTECAVDSFSQGLERSFTVSSSVLHGLEPRLKDFHQLLLRPPKKKAILTTIGVLEEPLGNARLHGARLMAALLHTNTPSINQELCRLNTMDLLLDLFFKYTWNNFLHFQVELCVAAILSHAAAGAGGPESKEEPPRRDGNAVRDPETPQPATSLPENTMVTHLFQKCCLVQRILEAWEANDHTQAAGGMRRGNMGHLTRIANAVVQNLERGPVQTHISEVIRGPTAALSLCRGRPRSCSCPQPVPWPPQVLLLPSACAVAEPGPAPALSLCRGRPRSYCCPQPVPWPPQVLLLPSACAVAAPGPLLPSACAVAAPGPAPALSLCRGRARSCSCPQPVPWPPQVLLLPSACAVAGPGPAPALSLCRGRPRSCSCPQPVPWPPQVLLLPSACAVAEPGPAPALSLCRGRPRSYCCPQPVPWPGQVLLLPSACAVAAPGPAPALSLCRGHPTPPACPPVLSTCGCGHGHVP
nr:serine/threonine-protein phosphatase 6 regulatory subunit 2 isoform X4 [Oryctolagus cuniculus]